MDARTVAKQVALGRIALGAGLLLAPRRLSRGWVGDDADRASVTVLARGLGMRDLVIGGIQLHTLDHPEVAPRWQRTAAACDLVDAAASVGARRELPLAGALGVALLAASAAALQLWAAGELAATAPATSA